MANKYAYFNEPQGDFDFHYLGRGLTPDEIKDYTLKCIEEARKNGWEIMRLIVGKGIHSKNGPIIKPTVLKYLQYLKEKDIIEFFDYDKTFFNGPNSGAIVVKL